MKNKLAETAGCHIDRLIFTLLSSFNLYINNLLRQKLSLVSNLPFTFVFSLLFLIILLTPSEITQNYGLPTAWELPPSQAYHRNSAFLQHPAQQSLSPFPLLFYIFFILVMGSYYKNLFAKTINVTCPCSSLTQDCQFHDVSYVNFIESQFCDWL